MMVLIATFLSSKVNFLGLTTKKGSAVSASISSLIVILMLSTELAIPVFYGRHF